MDNFSVRITEALDNAGKQMLFEQLDESAFAKIESLVFTEVKNKIGAEPQIRWIEHALKLGKNTFSSTFLIQGPNGKDDIRKFTISPEITQMSFSDDINNDSEVTKQVPLEQNRNKR